MKVSIITPYYKSANFIFNTVNSVLKQSYTNWEMIIVDDENSINSRTILNKISVKSKKIKVIKNKKNLGAALSRNRGVKKSNGEYIAFLDSDDSWSKEKLKIQLDYMRKNKIHISFTSYTAKTTVGKNLYKVPAKDKLNYYDLLKECPICCSSVIVHKSLLFKNKFKKLDTKEDYELWLNLAKKNCLYGVKQFLTNFTVRKKSLSSKHLNKIKNAFLIFYKFNRLSLLKSLIYILNLYYNAFVKKYL